MEGAVLVLHEEVHYEIFCSHLVGVDETAVLLVSSECLGRGGEESVNFVRMVDEKWDLFDPYFLPTEYWLVSGRVFIDFNSCEESSGECLFLGFDFCGDKNPFAAHC